MIVVEWMRQQPDLDRLPYPPAWVKKYGFPEIKAITPREFMDSGHTMKMMYAPKDLPPLILNKPQRDGVFPELLKVEPPKVEVIQRPFAMTDEFPAVLPSLEEFKDPPASETQVGSHSHSPTPSVSLETCDLPRQDDTQEPPVHLPVSG